MRATSSPSRLSNVEPVETEALPSRRPERPCQFVYDYAQYDRVLLQRGRSLRDTQYAG